jgi:Na+/melibiose symporter-like transporter
MILGLTGVLTAETPGLTPMLIAFSAVGSARASVLSITVMSALADSADENELAHGVRQEGVLYSTRNLAAKIDQALGAALAGFALAVISFPPKAKPGTVPDEVLYNLVFVDGVLATIPGLIAAVCYARYNITRARYDATKAALAARRAAA